MSLPSFDAQWEHRKQLKLRIRVLEIRDRCQPDQEPIAWLFVERSETQIVDKRDGNVSDASICLDYERILPRQSRRPAGRGRFSAKYSRGFGNGSSVSLTSGAVFLDLPDLEGHRIGTYLMNEIVLWAQCWKDASVRPVRLLVGQAHEGNKARRNRFYEQFGLLFEYADLGCNEGVSKPMLAGALTPVDTWKQNIRELDIRDYVGDLLYHNERLTFELSQRERGVKNLLEQLRRAEARPIRWALPRLWWRIAPTLLKATILATLGIAAWLWSQSK